MLESDNGAEGLKVGTDSCYGFHKEDTDNKEGTDNARATDAFMSALSILSVLLSSRSVCSAR